MKKPNECNGKRIPLNEEYAIECESCDCLFIPGGRYSTKICAGCYAVLVSQATERLSMPIKQIRGEGFRELIGKMREATSPDEVE